MAYKGRYKVKNSEKYTGDCSKVTYRSSWELFYMKWADASARVVSWNSEEIIVPYICPTDGKAHRYYTDFYIKVIDNNGNITKNIIEIKPYKETIPPRKSKNKYTYERSVKTYIKNQAKWRAAKKYAEERGMKFYVLTENELNIPGTKKKKRNVK